MVLVEPAGPLNVGSVARLCANYNIQDLRLVAPRCDPADPEAVRMAVHGDAVLQHVTIFPSLLEAVADCQQVVASCGRIDHGEIPASAPELDGCLRDAEELLLEVGFLLEHTANARMAKVKGLVQRALIRSDEVALLRGMVRQLRWAARRNRP